MKTYRPTTAYIHIGCFKIKDANGIIRVCDKIKIQSYTKSGKSVKVLGYANNICMVERQYRITFVSGMGISPGAGYINIPTDRGYYRIQVLEEVVA